MLGGSIHTIRLNTEPSAATGNGNGLEVNAKNTKYAVMCRD